MEPIKWYTLTQQQKMDLVIKHLSFHPVFYVEDSYQKDWLTHMKAFITEKEGQENRQMHRLQLQANAASVQHYNFPVIVFNSIQQQYEMVLSLTERKPFKPLSSMDDALWLLDTHYPLATLVFHQDTAILCRMTIWHDRKTWERTIIEAMAPTRSEALILALLQSVGVDLDLDLSKEE